MTAPQAAARSLGALALAGLVGAAAARGSAWGLALALPALIAYVSVVGHGLGGTLRAHSAAREELRAIVAATTEELEKRGAELAASVRQLEVARQHLGVTDRLAAVGRLAGGVAHEVNNPLAIALTNIGWVREHLTAAANDGVAVPARAELVTALEEAEEASQRVARTVRDLQEFAQDRSAGSSAADLTMVLQNVTRLVAPEVHANARLRVDLPHDPLWVAGASPRLGQLFAHLLLHAARASAAGARGELRLVARRERETAVIEVHDEGPALDPDALTHVFDPFYDAWSTGDAAGLGLAVCHGLAGALGGEITAERAEGGGTLYRVRLPLLTSQARLALRRVDSTRPRVLVLDDEPLVCASLYRLLSRRFDVVPQTSAHQALTLLRAGEQFDAVVCDVVMPELSGPEFFERLQHARPELAERVVFLTGGALPESSRAFLERNENPRLQKPCEASELIAVVCARCPGPTAKAS
jgi:signal transduction histidine kinase/ActR/RegA family two-component response regulator